MAEKQEVTQMLFGELDNYGASQTGLVLPPDLSFEMAEELGRRLGRLNNASMFWLGDWANYCEGTYSDRYSQLMDVTGYSLSTLRNAASVCKAVPYERRRSEDHVTFSHHRKVMAMHPEQQVYWLEQTAKLMLPVEGLGAAIKDAQRMLGVSSSKTKRGPGRPRKGPTIQEAEAAVRQLKKPGRPRKEAAPEQPDERDPDVVKAQEAQRADNGAAPQRPHIVDTILAALLELRKAGVEFDKAATKLEKNLTSGDLPYEGVSEVVAALRLFDAARDVFLGEVLALRRMQAEA